jgi:hypothetical protein
MYVCIYEYVYIYIYIKSNVYWLPFDEVYFESVKQNTKCALNFRRTIVSVATINNKQQQQTSLYGYRLRQLFPILSTPLRWSSCWPLKFSPLDIIEFAWYTNSSGCTDVPSICMCPPHSYGTADTSAIL